MSCKCASSLQKMIYSRYFAARYAKKIILAMLNLTICPKNSNYLVSKIQDFSCIFGELAKKSQFVAASVLAWAGANAGQAS